MVGRGGNVARFERFRGGSGARDGTVIPAGGFKVLPPASDTALRSRTGRLGRLGSAVKLPGRGIRPGSVVAGFKPAVAGFSGARGVREGLVEVGRRGTVGKPVCSSLGMVGGAEELIDRADSDPSRPEGTAGAAGGVTAESCTSVNPSFSGLTGSLEEVPGKLIFFPSSNGRVGILWRYP